MEKAAIDLMMPVMEGAVIVAAEYCKAAGRTVLLAKDMELGMKYGARKILGNYSGTLFPEIEDLYDEKEEEDEEDEEDDDEEWTRYEGDDPKMKEVNDAYDSWNDWVPITPVECALKSAIEKSTGYQ